MYVCVYVCTCMYVYVCIYVSMYVCMYMYVCTCMYVCITCMYVCTCMYLCMYVCTCMYVCMYECITCMCTQCLLNQIYSWNPDTYTSLLRLTLFPLSCQLHYLLMNSMLPQNYFYILIRFL